ncbi:LOW QUALITY PROTEIN: centrosomal protein CCDC61 [Chlamydotis macqueenii]
MEEPRRVQADRAFRDGGHTVRLTLAPSGLGVEVEAHLTAEQWRGEFDAAFIEDLTRRTGNFKQFGIFCSMLESALTQTGRSVSLELLTYADLETLRSQKAGTCARRSPPAASPLGAKRYLILVYSVEFDRIHYPLPLPYAGRLDGAALHGPAQLRARRGESRPDPENRRLRDKLQRALEEKRAAEAALQALRAEKDGGAAAEAAALLRVMQDLEAERLREKARHQRELRQLAAEVAEAKAAERRLQLQVKRLTAELASCQRGRGTATSTAPRPPERRSTSAPRLRPRSTSRESRRGDRGRPPPPPARSPSPAGEGRPGAARAPCFVASAPRHLCSVPGPRFDPTAFVRARRRRQEEAELKKSAAPRGCGGRCPSGPRPPPALTAVSLGCSQRRRAAFGSASPAGSRGRSSSAESFQSRRSAVSSGSEADERSQPLPRRGRRVACARRPLSTSSCNTPGMAPRRKVPGGSAAGKRLHKENRYEEPSAELAEIDARLRALQEYMHSLDACA